MFTGIIQGIGKLVFKNKKKNYKTYVVKFPYYLLDGLKIGDSVSNNGCCLSVVNINKNQVSFDLISETLRITNLNNLKIGDQVNLERSLKLKDEIGGSIVSGHVICTASIINFVKNESNVRILLYIDNLDIMKFIFYKGSIVVDGISLTVGEVFKDRFFVYIIPETIRSTTIYKKKIGETVNIEIDNYSCLIVKNIERIMRSNF